VVREVGGSARDEAEAVVSGGATSPRAPRQTRGSVEHDELQISPCPHDTGASEERAHRHAVAKGRVDGRSVMTGPDSGARPPIWMISLARATDRRAFVADGFARLGVPYEVIDGIDGAALTHEQRRRSSQLRALFRKGRRITGGNLGCSLSHLSVYERMVTEQVPAVVVMEDDAVPKPELLQVLDDLDSFPADWDVITFSSQFATSLPVPIDDRVIAGGHRICRYQKVPFGGQCYVVTLAAARRLLRVGYPVCMPPDDLLFQRSPARLRVYGVEPRLTIDGEFESEIGARPDVVDTPSIARSPLDRAIVVTGKAWFRVQRLFDRRPLGADR